MQQAYVSAQCALHGIWHRVWHADRKRGNIPMAFRFAKRQLLALGISSILAVSMVACGAASSGSPSGGTPASAAATSTATTAAKSPIAGGGVTITKPFAKTVSGAQCYAGTGDNKGKAAFGFPTRQPISDATLAFTLGPITDGSSPGQENNPPYTGAGAYTNIGIFVGQPGGMPLAGYGTVTVNADLQSGSFDMGSAAGTWNCGSPVTP
jgi:hypothetical protein